MFEIYNIYEIDDKKRRRTLHVMRHKHRITRTARHDFIWITKWIKRLFLVVLILYIFEIYMLEVSVINKAMFLSDDRKLIVVEKPECLNNTQHSGYITVDMSRERMEKLEDFLASTVTPGGVYRPPNCTSKQKIAMVVPFRDREQHLVIFLRHMHPYLQNQQLEYEIFVIEMFQNMKFNRAILMNIGFVEAMKRDNFTCFVFHDVDLLPEDDGISYACADMPKHLSVAVDKFNYTMPYDELFGGACAIRTEHFREVNGMSNLFFGWGGEDDDFSRRIRASGLRIERPSAMTARYKMIKHTEDSDINPERICLLNSSALRLPTDGLSNLKYTLKQTAYRQLFTWILVSINETEQVQSDGFSFNVYKNCTEMTKRKLEMIEEEKLMQVT